MVLTGSRADYGLLHPLIRSIQLSAELELQLVATGMHLSERDGLTYRYIETDGFNIDRKVDLELSTEDSSVARATGLGMIAFEKLFAELDPDMLIVLGDRFEILAAAFAALTSGIPIAHIHGGELTSAVFDEAIRHSVTKMAWWHFVSTEVYRKRVIQLGESPDRVYFVGALGIENIEKLELYSKDELEQIIGFKLGNKSLLITYHPVTLETNSELQLAELLTSLSDLKATKLIFTAPNADSFSTLHSSMIEVFVSKNRRNAEYLVSMGQKVYLSALQCVDAIVGNSSSGIIEAPILRTPTINIGSRQDGRLKSSSIYDSKPDRESISNAISNIYTKSVQDSLKKTTTLYAGGDVSGKITDILCNVDLPKNLIKKFRDL